MLSEDEKKLLIASLHNISYTCYSGITFNPFILRVNEDYPRFYNRLSGNYGLVSLTFIPTTQKFGDSLDKYWDENTNTNYSTYAYGEQEICVIRSFARDYSGYKGRDYSYKWLKKIEGYIKVYWNSLLTGITVNRGSVGPYREITSQFAENQYGYEMQIGIMTTNAWTNEPESGAISCVPISGIEFGYTGYNTKFNTWLEDE